MIKHPLLTPVIMTCNDSYWLPFCLESSRGYFSRYVIYDIGSTDGTKEIIEWFINSNKNAEFYYRSFDSIISPQLQGVFRNSMISECRSDYYFILDADELYSPKSYENILKQTEELKDRYRDGKIYGIVPRVEVAANLSEAYGLNRKVSHHRIYHRTAIWEGSHPGEVPFYEQKPKREMWFEGITCWHFHNCERSPKDAEVPRRLERRGKGTYRPGETEPFYIFEELPILKEPINNFKLNPVLEEKQILWHAVETGSVW